MSTNTEKENNSAQLDPVRKKIRQNKIFYYGFPVFVLACVFLGLLYIVLPTINLYFKSREDNKVLDANLANVNTSIQNFKRASQEEALIRSYDTTLSEYVPENPKLGDIINVIQTKAKDFGLESRIDISRIPDKTTLDNIAKRDENNKALFESVTSGELTFQPKSANENVSAVLLSIEVSLKGNKSNLLEFTKNLQGTKPLINLVSIEYTESQTQSADRAINGLVRFEAYAVKINTNVTNTSKQYDKKDEALLKEIKVETFEWDNGISKTIQTTPQ